MRLKRASYTGGSLLFSAVYAAAAETPPGSPPIDSTYTQRLGIHSFTLKSTRAGDTVTASACYSLHAEASAPVRKTASFFECFPYVRPEPVLVKWLFVYTNGSKMPFFAGLAKF